MQKLWKSNVIYGKVLCKSALSYYSLIMYLRILCTHSVVSVLLSEREISLLKKDEIKVS